MADSNTPPDSAASVELPGDHDSVRRVFDAVDDMVIVTHRDRGIVYLNNAARALFPDDPMGKFMLSYLPPNQQRLVEDTVRPDVFSMGRWKGDLPFPIGDLARTFAVTVVPVADDPESEDLVGIVMRDVTDERDHSLQLAHQIRRDHLTGLPNRLALSEHLQRCISSGPSDGIITVCFMDLDNLKIINDGIGHSAGDKMLTTVAQRLSAPDATMVARFGGDEFVIVYEDTPPTVVLAQVTEMLEGLRREPVAGLVSRIDASIGVASAPRDGLDPETLVKDADAAMYRAKRGGRAQVVAFDTSMRQIVERRFALETEMRSALANNEMTIALQPIMAVATGTITGTESLARWTRATPYEFIPVAEESGLINELGLWALEETLRWRNALIESVSSQADLIVGVNVSPRQLDDPAFVSTVLRTLERHDAPPNRIALELTESAFIEPDQAGRRALHALHDAGVTLAVDDFGSGYSSLGYLQHFPIEVLKLDIELTHALTQDSKTRLIAEAVVKLAHSLGIRVVAEGIETEEHLAAVRELDIAWAQGYFIGRPMAPDVLADLIVAGNP